MRGAPEQKAARRGTDLEPKTRLHPFCCKDASVLKYLEGTRVAVNYERTTYVLDLEIPSRALEDWAFVFSFLGILEGFCEVTAVMEECAVNLLVN
jgi:hypothetical protein